MKPIITTLVLFSIVCLTIPKVNSQEVCEKHNNLNNTIEAQNCKLYCCGSCNRRYCCNSRANRFNQELCVPEDCLAYYDIFQVQNQPKYCFGRLCCGSCDDRYCCSNPTSRLNQSSCTNGEPTKTTNSGYFLQDITRKSKRALSFIYWSIVIFFILIICFFIWRYCDVRKRRRQRQQITNNANNNFIFLGSTPSTLNSQRQRNNIINNFEYPRNTSSNLNNGQNNTNISSDAEQLVINVQPQPSNNDETNNISNTNVYDDLPPSYASLIIKDKTTEETVETNANNP